MKRGERIAKAREEMGWTVQEYSDRLGIHHRTLRGYEKGYKPIPSLVWRFISYDLGLVDIPEPPPPNTNSRRHQMKMWRIAHGLRVVDMADLLGTSQTSLTNWENGVRQVPNIAWSLFLLLAERKVPAFILKELEDD